MYKLGDYNANTRKELGINVVNSFGLGLEDDENIGKKVKFKKPSCEMEKKIYVIVGRQKAWGYDENGNYTMIDGYRGVPEDSDNFGRPLHLYEVDFI